MSFDFHPFPPPPFFLSLPPFFEFSFLSSLFFLRILNVPSQIRYLFKVNLINARVARSTSHVAVLATLPSRNVF